MADAAAKSAGHKPKNDAKKAEADQVSVSASIPVALKEALDARAEDEERTLSVIIKRALKAYMEEWIPEGDL